MYCSVFNREPQHQTSSTLLAPKLSPKSLQRPQVSRLFCPPRHRLGPQDVVHGLQVVLQAPCVEAGDLGGHVAGAAKVHVDAALRQPGVHNRPTKTGAV